MSEKYLGKYITIDNLSNSKAEIIPVGNTEQNIIEEVKGNTVIGTNIVVNDVESTAAKIKLIGDIQQEVREGYNLLAVDEEHCIQSSVSASTITYLEDGWVQIKNNTEAVTYINYASPSKNIVAGKSYTLKVEFADSNKCNIFLQKSNDDYSKVMGTTGNVTNVATTNYMNALISLTANMTIKVRLTLVEGTIAKDWEAYGKAPTSNFPSEVKTVTGNVEVKVDNKNYIDITDIPNWSISMASGYRGKEFNLKPSTNYTISQLVDRISSTTGNKVSYIFAISGKYAGGSFSSGIDGALVGKPITVKTDTNGVLTIFVSNTEIKEEYGLMLEEGSTATDYVAHQSQVFPLTLGSLELCKIGDYADYLYRAGSKWFKRSYIKKIKITSSLNIITTNVGTNSYYFWLDGIYSNTSKICVLSNYFYGVSNDDRTIERNYKIYNDGLNDIIFRDTDFATLDEFKTFLNNNEVYIYYILATPTDTEITDTTLIAQLNAIKEASAYPGTTVIISTGDVLPINVEFTYNHVVPSPSLEIPSEVKSVGDDVNLCINNYTEDNKLTFTANKDDDIVVTSVYAPLEAGKAYRLSFESDGKYGYTNGTDTVQAFLMRNKQYDSVINIYNLNEKIIPTVSGDYYIRVDINQKGKTYSFWNFKISEYSNTKSIYSPEGMGAIKHVICNKNLAYNITYQSTNKVYHPVTSAKYRLLKDSYYIVSANTENTGTQVYINSGYDYGIKRISNYLNKCDGTRKYWIIQALDSKEHFSNFINKEVNDSIYTGFCSDFMIEKIPATSDKEALTYLPTEYVENKKQEYIIPTQKPFRTIGDYKDTFINIEGKWYENHVIGKHIIIEDEIDLNFVKLENGFNRFVINAKENPIKEQYRLKLGYCNKYPYLEDFSHDSYHCYISDGGNIYMFSQAPTIEAFKSELGTDTYVIYPLDEPELIPCTPQQENILKQLQNIHMYSGTNNFYGESFIEPQINLTVKKSVEDYDMYITADGYLHIPELNKRYLVDLYESNIPIMPEAVESSVRVAGRDGDIGLNTTYEPIPFNIVCYTEDDLSLLEKVNEEKAMNKFLNKIKNKKIKLAFEKYDSYYEVKYNLALVTSNYPKHLKFSIPLKSSDSYGKELIKKIIIGSASKESDTIENVGAIFTIYGPAISPIISLNDYSMEFSTDILEGSRIEIDSNKSTITHINSDGVKTNVMKYYNHQFPKIENGNNQLKILSGIKNGGNVIVEWNDLKL